MEGPVDIICLKVAELIAPVFYALGHTPNMVTTYSLVTGLASVYFLYAHNLPAFIGLNIASYIFDCTDGYMARRYKMVSKFGDLYDHLSDITVNGLLAYAVYTIYGWKRIAPLFYLGVALLFGMLFYFGCSQSHHNKGDAEELLDLCRLLNFHPETYKWARYFSCGTFKFFTIAAIAYLELSKK